MEENSQRSEIVVEKLTRNFFTGTLNFDLDASEVELLCVLTQEKLLNQTMNSNLVKNYPVSQEFVRLYLKKLLSYIESSQEVHDSMYEFMCSVMCNKQETNNFCYRHYIIDNNFQNTVTLKETKNMVINGTTGLRTWEAALILADWILCNKDIFKHKKVLELGSGVGLTGITVGKLCDVTSIILTDCHDEVLKTIDDNIQINFPNSHRNISTNGTVYKDGNKSIGFSYLDWNDFDSSVCIENPDIIIGADIVYDPSILEPLCKVLKIFFEKNQDLHVFIACIVRNENTLKEFHNILRSNKMSLEQIEITNNVHLEWNTKIQRCFVKINYKKYVSFLLFYFKIYTISLIKE